MTTKFQVGDTVTSVCNRAMRYRVRRVRKGGIVDLVCISFPTYGPEIDGQRVSILEKAED